MEEGLAYYGTERIHIPYSQLTKLGISTGVRIPFTRFFIGDVIFRHVDHIFVDEERTCVVYIERTTDPAPVLEATFDFDTDDYDNDNEEPDTYTPDVDSDVEQYVEDFESYDLGSFSTQAEWTISNPYSFTCEIAEVSESNALRMVKTDDSLLHYISALLFLGQDSPLFAAADGSDYVQFTWTPIKSGSTGNEDVGCLLDLAGNVVTRTIYYEAIDTIRWEDGGGLHDVSFDAGAWSPNYSQALIVRLYIDSSTTFHWDVSQDDGDTWHSSQSMTMYSTPKTRPGWIRFTLTGETKEDGGMVLDDICTSWKNLYTYTAEIESQSLLYLEMVITLPSPAAELKLMKDSTAFSTFAFAPGNVDIDGEDVAIPFIPMTIYIDYVDDVVTLVGSEERVLENFQSYDIGGLDLPDGWYGSGELSIETWNGSKALRIQGDLFEETFSDYELGNFTPQAGPKWTIDNPGSQDVQITTMESSKALYAKKANSNYITLRRTLDYLPEEVEMDGSQYVEFKAKFGADYPTVDLVKWDVCLVESTSIKCTIQYKYTEDKLYVNTGAGYVALVFGDGWNPTLDTPFIGRLFMYSGAKFHLETSEDGGSSWHTSAQWTNPFGYASGPTAIQFQAGPGVGYASITVDDITSGTTAGYVDYPIHDVELHVDAFDGSQYVQVDFQIDDPGYRMPVLQVLDVDESVILSTWYESGLKYNDGSDHDIVFSGFSFPTGSPVKVRIYLDSKTKFHWTASTDGTTWYSSQDMDVLSTWSLEPGFLRCGNDAYMDNIKLCGSLSEEVEKEYSEVPDEIVLESLDNDTSLTSVEYSSYGVEIASGVVTMTFAASITVYVPDRMSTDMVKLYYDFMSSANVVGKDYAGSVFEAEQTAGKWAGMDIDADTWYNVEVLIDPVTKKTKMTITDGTTSQTTTTTFSTIEHIPTITFSLESGTYRKIKNIKVHGIVERVL